MSSLYDSSAMLAVKLKELYQDAKKYKSILENAHIAVFGYDTKFRGVFWNEAAKRVFGYEKEEIIGKNIENFIKFSYLRSNCLESFLNERSSFIKTSFFRKDKSFVKAYCNFLKIEEEGENFIICFCIEEKSLKKEKKKYREEILKNSILYMADLLIVMLDKEANIIEFNQFAQKLTGYSKEEVLYKNWFDIFIDKEKKEEIKRVFKEVIGEKDFHWGHENEIICKDGSKKMISWHNSVFSEDDEKIVIAMGMDVTDKIDTQKSLEKMANFDYLTSLPNRYLFEDRLKHAIFTAQRDNKKLMTMFLDIDNFKSINDTLGHRIGDRLLQSVALRLQNSIRKSDTVARFGGDFFVLLFENIKDEKHTISIVKNIFNLFKRPFEVGGHEIYVNVSGGVSLYPNDCPDSACLLRCADIALHNAKKEGKNDFCFYNSKMNDEIIKRVRLESYLRNALKNGELFLVYQPQIDLKTKKVIGVEALLRWMHPTLKMIPPLDFIPIAEDTKMILEIGEFALKSALSQLKYWEKLGIDIKVVINISSVQIAQGNFFSMVDSLLRKFEVDSKKFGIEITESVLMKNMERSAEVLNKFKERGIDIAIDDFGTGYSSLAYLKKFPINSLKIDKTFIDDLPINSDSISIAKAIISMGKSLGMEIVAEGVENENQLNFLLKEGCDQIQGYFFSKPLLAGEVVSFIQNFDYEYFSKKNENDFIDIKAI